MTDLHRTNDLSKLFLMIVSHALRLIAIRNQQQDPNWRYHPFANVTISRHYDTDPTEHQMRLIVQEFLALTSKRGPVVAITETTCHTHDEKPGATITIRAICTDMKKLYALNNLPFDEASLEPSYIKFRNDLRTRHASPKTP